LSEKPKRVTRLPLPDGRLIDAQDLEFKVIREDFNLYELEDGTILKMRVVAGKISRGIDPETGGILYAPNSNEPYYNIRSQTVIMAEVPEKLIKH
jgi:hypothetical protein